MSPRIVKHVSASMTSSAKASAVTSAVGAAVFVGVFAVIVGVVAAVQPASAQRPSEASTPQGQAPPAVPGGGGGRGGPQGPPPPARQGAPVDFVGNWVSVVPEDWHWRMMTPKKGDYASVPLTAEGRRVADTWDVSQDGLCQANGVGGLMRLPGRLRISWQDDNTLKIETDAGVQTRLLRFPVPGTPASPVSAAAAAGACSLQGTSVAEWQRAGGAFDAFLERGAGGAAPQRWGGLRVTTTNHTGGWLRRNGVSYSQNAVISEFFTRISNPDAGDWFVVTTVVDDPPYLAQPFVTSSNFKKEADGSKWSPVACRS
jgi:hypothetical protein